MYGHYFEYLCTTLLAEKVRFALLISATIVISALNIVEPYIIMRIVDQIPTGIAFRSSYILFALWVGVYLVQHAILFMKLRLQAHIQYGQEKLLRERLLACWMDSEPVEHRRRHEDVAVNMSKDIERVAGVWNELLLAISWGGTLIVVSCVLALLFDVPYTIFILFCIACVVGVDALVLRKATPHNAMSRSAVAELVSIVNIAIRNIRLVQSHGYESVLLVRAESQAENIRENNRRVAPWHWLALSAGNAFELLALATVLILGSWLVVNETVSIGLLFAVVLYINLMAIAFRRVAENLLLIPQGAVSYNAIFDFLQVEKRDGDSANVDGTTESIRQLQLDAVGFSYGNNEVFLRNVSHTFEKGRLHLIVGGNGCGKTTLMGILSGYLNPSTGIVLINGKRRHDGDFYRIRDNISIVDPGHIVMEQSVRFNLLPAWSPEVFQAFLDRDANIFESAAELSELLDRDVASLSQGQQQKIGITRSLLRISDVYLLDEPTNFLDSDSIVRLMRIVEGLCMESIVIVATNNLGLFQSFADADFLVLDKHT